jgi:4-hydroxybenzoate polyprenyltransferase
MWTATLFAWLVWRLLPAFLATVRDPSPGPIRRAVRTGVLSLVLVNGVIAAAYAGIIYSLAVLATGLLAWWLARRFAVT